MLKWGLMVNYVHETKRLRFVTLLLVVIGIITISLSCSPKGYSGPVESITLGFAPSEASCLMYVAEERGFFTANGVEVVKKYYDTGAGAMEALLQNEVDIAGMSEVPFITQVFAKKEISIYANIDKLQYVYLFCRKDRGIKVASDLKGKRLGLPMGTISEFYLGSFLELNGLRIQDLTLLETAPPAAMNALTAGSLDGVVVWNPFAYQIRQQMAGEVAILRLQSNQPAYALAVARNAWLVGHKGVISRSLKAIAQAEQYIINHPEEARAIVQKRMNYDTAFMEIIWPENQFSVLLDQSLILAMEDEARWMMSNNLTTEKAVPNFLNYISEDALKTVKPEAVKIIR
jgi:ABC-type nitrate/sulfonate/bicarbonate transport system substrate-binding protein